MSEDEKVESRPGHLRRHGKNYAKIAIAITGLTAAIDRYLDLEEKNSVVYEALAGKVNGLSRELSELKGQNHILLVFIQSRMGAEMGSLEPGFAEDTYSMGESELISGEAPTADEEWGELEDEGVEVEAAAIVEAREGARPRPIPASAAFRELPAKVEDLLQAQQKNR